MHSLYPFHLHYQCCNNGGPMTHLRCGCEMEMLLLLQEAECIHKVWPPEANHRVRGQVTYDSSVEVVCCQSVWQEQEDSYARVVMV